MRTSRFGAVALLTAVLALTSCATVTVNQPTESAAPNAAPAPSADPVAALARYVDLERGAMPAVMEQFPGVFKSVDVNGEVVENPAGVPAGSYSTVTFEYTYEASYDMDAARASIAATESQIDELCTNTVFPAMRVSGVVEPYALTYVYRGSEPVETIASITCTSND